jgi:broad specificity phosphatase PhoE
MTFKDKYLKYKIKYLNYLNLKTQFGSGNTYTSIIVTHNGKLRCLLDKLGFSDNENHNTREKKFMNCVILKLEITSNQMSIKMIDQGNLSKDDKYSLKPYFTTFDKILDNGLPEVGNNKFIFYLIRHGDGTHNKAKIRGTNEKIIDPSLTKIGEEQCIEVGRKLSAHLENWTLDPQGKAANSEVNFLFVSELVRTRQSLYYILKGGIDFKPIYEKFNKVIVLPCSREIVYLTDSCDVNQASTQENEMLCNPEISENLDYCNNLPPINLNSNNLLIDWSYYTDFHGIQNIKRSANCKDTDMIRQAIKIIKLNKNKN